MTTTSASPPFSKRMGQHAKEQLTPVTAQHIDSASSTDTNKQALIVAGMSKSDQRSTAATQGREGALSPTDTAAVSASKRVGTSPKAWEKWSGSDAELKGPTKEAVSSNVVTHHSGKPRRSEDTVRQASLPDDTPTHFRRDMSHHDSNLRHSSMPAQPQGRQPQAEDGTASTSGSGVVPNIDYPEPSIDANLQQGPTIEGSSARFESKHSPAQEDTIDINEKGKDLARRCWEEDKEFLAKDKIAEWLSEQEHVNRIALRHCLQYFDFTGLRLDEAFRELCKKLYLKAETQQIDRILDEFGRRYWECNPDSVFGNASVTHVVSYSLMQLNTDLHVTKSTSKMSRDQFVNHTMESIQRHLQSKFSEDPPSLSSRADAPPRSNGSGTPNGQGSTPRIPTSFVLDEERRRQLERTLKDIYYATKREQIELNSAGIISSPAPFPDEALLDVKKPVGFASTLVRMALGEDFGDNQPSGLSEGTTSENIEITDEELALLGPPWAKEGILSHRYYKESPEEGTKSEEWVTVFAVVQKGELLMFKFGGHGAGQSNTVVNGSWWEKAQPAGNLQLAHSIAQARPPPGYTNQRQNCVTLTLADESVHFFQAGTEELVKEWVSTCNYWAARRSKEPLAGGNSNTEYGWNRVSSSSDKESDGASATSGRNITSPRNWVWSRTVRSVIIRDWDPPTPPTVTSTRDEKGQLEATKNHVSILETKLGEHSKLQQPMIALHKHHPGDSGKAQDNWDKRANYLQAEIFKYRLYAKSLESAMKLRPKKQQAPGPAAAVGRLLGQQSPQVGLG